jgi:hypothetical protein
MIWITKNISTWKYLTFFDAENHDFFADIHNMAMLIFENWC